MKIIVAIHKLYEVPHSSIYIPVHVGKQNKNDIGFIGDDTGEHISQKNYSFCELTALYWGWKNNFFDGCDFVGLVHYRRYFSGNGLLLKNKHIASEAEFLDILKDVDCIVAKKRNYIIESVYNHYKNAHYVKDIDITREIISEIYPDYTEAFDNVMQSKSLHLFNMFVMNKKLFDDYCQWLFHILFELEKRIDITLYNTYQKRVFGFIGERLLNVWLLKNNISIVEHKVVNIEGENTFKKGLKLLQRKFFGTIG